MALAVKDVMRLVSRQLATLALLTTLLTTATSVASQGGQPMQGFPPARDSQVTAFNYLQWPASQWAFHNIGAVLNTVTLPREGTIRELPYADNNKLTGYSACEQNDCSLEKLFAENHADGLVILQDGKILLEKYFRDFTEHSSHIWFSATKSLASTAFGIVVEQYDVDMNDSPVDYIPELAGTGWENVTIQQVLDHSTTLNIQETYTDTNSDFFRYYLPALNMIPFKGSRDVLPGDAKVYGVYDFLQHVIRPKASKEANPHFEYSSPNSDLLGWLIARISGLSFDQYVQKHIWSRLGTEHDALMVVDRAGMAVATAGMNTTLRDAARFGELIRLRGKVNKQQIVPADWVDASLQLSEQHRANMRANSKYNQMPYQAYHNMWWILDADAGEYMASGIHGQVIYIHRKAGVSAAWFSSQPIASAAKSSSFQKKLAAVRNAARFLIAKK